MSSYERGRRTKKKSSNSVQTFSRHANLKLPKIGLLLEWILAFLVKKVAKYAKDGGYVGKYLKFNKTRLINVTKMKLGR